MGLARLDPASFKYEKSILFEKKANLLNILLILRLIGLTKSLCVPFSLTFRPRSVLETHGLVRWIQRPFPIETIPCVKQTDFFFICVSVKATDPQTDKVPSLQLLVLHTHPHTDRQTDRRVESLQSSLQSLKSTCGSYLLDI